MGCPAGDVAADPVGLPSRSLHDRPVREAQHHEAEGGELGVAGPVVLELRRARGRASPSRRTPGRAGCRRSGSRPRNPPMRGWNSAAGSPCRSSSRRIAGSSTLSTGLPSSTQSPSASRSAGTPGRPRRPWRLIAASSAAGDARPVVTTWPTAPGTAAASSAPRSHSVRRMFVVRIPSRRDGLQVEQVTWPVGDDTWQRRLRLRRGQDDVDGLVDRSGDPPQAGRRPVRGHRAPRRRPARRRGSSGRGRARRRTSDRRPGGPARAGRARSPGTRSARRCRPCRQRGG